MVTTFRKVQVVSFAAAVAVTAAWAAAAPAAMANSSQMQTGWWSGVSAGWVGGGLGVLLGGMGSLVGVLTSLGRGRGLVMGVMKAMLMIGVAALATGIVALLKSQPYVVYYPLLLTGVLATVLSISLTPSVRRQYEQHELRKMQALDAAQK